MAEVTVAALNAKYIADTGEFTKGLGDVDRALRRTKSIVRDATTPMDKYNEKLQDIEINLRQGRITQEQARRAVEKANIAYEKASGGVRSYKDRLAKLTLTFAKVAAAAAAATRVLRTHLETLRAVADAARKSEALDLTIRQMEALRDAGREASLSAMAVDTAVQRMVRRLSEAGAGASEYQKALKELGLNARELSQLSTFDAAKQLADAFANVTDKQTRLRLAMKLFDTEGARLGDTLARLGSEGLGAVLEQQKEFGILNQRQARAMMQTQQTLETLGKAWDAFKTRATLAFSPILEGFAETITAGLKAMSRLAAAFEAPLKMANKLAGALVFGGPLAVVKAVANGISRAMKALEPITTRLNTLFEKAAAIWSRINNIIGDRIMRVLGRLTEPLERAFIATLEAAAKLLDMMIRQLDRMERILERYSFGMYKPTEAGGAFKTPAIESGGSIQATPTFERGSLAAFQFLQQSQRDRLERDFEVQQEQLLVQKKIEANTSGQPQRATSGAALAVG